ncbi:serine O-acetyltransferase [Caldimonas tepidiphila]|uniref:serine O-acetyltransferase n=1 Tax=Caldimonas tepidiphila TaxID=2315841 RepID=UPI000E5AA3A6|nr:serine O-acetyltransferase [Caldimonas tepidiphila]
MNFSEYKFLITSDLYRISPKKTNLPTLLKALVFGESYKYIFWMRTCNYTRSHPLLKLLAYPVARLMLHRLTYKLGIWIPPGTNIGSGFYIGHFGGIIINPECVIGKNCNLSHGVTLGQANRGRNKGTPVLGDNVYIGPGAKIVGAVRIGNNVAIGANSVVTRDVPNDAVVAGNPARVISLKGSAGYVNNTDYEEPGVLVTAPAQHAPESA